MPPDRSTRCAMYWIALGLRPATRGNRSPVGARLTDTDIAPALGVWGGGAPCGGGGGGGHIGPGARGAAARGFRPAPTPGAPPRRARRRRGKKGGHFAVAPTPRGGPPRVKKNPPPAAPPPAS